MADAKKCDRCGKYYDLKDRREIVNHPKFSEQHRKFVWIRCLDDLDRRIGDFDLCDDCAEKLYKFLCNEAEG